LQQGTLSVKQGVYTMLEQLIESDEILEEGPYLRRLHKRVERATKLQIRRDSTLEIITERFDPAGAVYDEIEHKLMQIDDLERLHQLFTAALRSPDLDSFVALLS
jgi:hypothetical protein